MDELTNYKEKLYSRYVSTHTYNLYGETRIDKIGKQFPVWINIMEDSSLKTNLLKLLL